MPSPKGIYIGESAESLTDIIAVAKARIASGDRTSLSGAGKSSGRSFSMPADEMLREARWALGRLNGTNVSRTHFDASGQTK